jgi:hypothetical protein
VYSRHHDQRFDLMCEQASDYESLGKEIIAREQKKYAPL